MRLVPKMLTDPITYGYAVGRVKVLETKLFNRARVERLIQAENLSEQIGILAETDYGEFFEDVQTAEDVEIALNRYLGKIYNFIEETCSETAIVRFFRIKYDYHNLKVLLKTKYLGTDGEKIWSDLGLLNVDEAKEYIDEESPDSLPEPFNSDVKWAMEEFEQKQDSQEIDVALDRGLYREWYKTSESLRNGFLINFTRIAIDLANLRTIVRAKNLARQNEFIVRALYDNGSIDKETLISLSARPLSDMIDQLSKTAYGPVFAGIVKGRDRVDLEMLDKLSDNFLFGQAKKAKLVAIGPEPLVGYILAKENEASAVRIILTGRLNGLSTSVIEERVRDLYV